MGSKIQSINIIMHEPLILVGWIIETGMQMNEIENVSGSLLENRLSFLNIRSYLRVKSLFIWNYLVYLFYYVSKEY